MSGGSPLPPPSAASFPPPAPPAPIHAPLPAARATFSVGRPQLAGLAAILAGVGLLFPWASIVTIFGRIEVNGLDTDDGKIVLGAAIAVAVLAFLGRRGSLIAAAVVAILGAALCLFEIVDINGRLGSSASEGVQAQVGW